MLIGPLTGIRSPWPLSDRGSPTLATVSLIAALLNACTVALISRVVHPRGRQWDVAFRLQMYLILMSLPVAFAAYASGLTLLLLALLTIISLGLLEWTPAIVASVWSSVGVRLPHSTPRARTVPVDHE